MTQDAHQSLDFYAIDLSYGPTTQRFFVGAGAASWASSLVYAQHSNGGGVSP